MVVFIISMVFILCFVVFSWWRFIVRSCDEEAKEEVSMIFDVLEKNNEMMVDTIFGGITEAFLKGPPPPTKEFMDSWMSNISKLSENNLKSK
jgi:hypothetical protein